MSTRGRVRVGAVLCSLARGTARFYSSLARGTARFYTTALLFAVLISAAGRARAESLDDERARAHFAAAEVYFEDQRFEDAAREFDEAYQLSGRPEMLINLSRSQERAGHLEPAIAALELLLERHPQTSYRAEAETQLAKLKERRSALAKPSVAASAGAPEGAVATAPPRARPKLWPPRWPTLVVGGATLATALVAVGTAWGAHAKYGDLDERCRPDSTCLYDFEDDRTRGRRLSRTSTGFTFAALALAGVTAALWVYDIEAKGAQLRLGLRTSPSLAAADLQLEF